MYTQHFGLEKAVFDGGIAQGDELFLGPQQQRVAANLKIGLTTRDSIVTLTGRLGVGKTTIASEALRITATRLAQTWVGNTPLAPDEMLELLLAGFEFTPYDMGRVQRLHTWRQFMGELSVTDTRICILVENAFALGIEALQALEALTAADPNDCPGANLVLMGPASLHELLETPELAPLQQRIRSNQRLDALTPQEVEQYLQHRITVVGGNYDEIFAPATAAMIHCFSAGVPRVINNICETALTVAATRKVTQLTPHIVQRVAEGVYGLAPSVQLPEAAVAAAPVVAASPAAVVEQQAEAPVPPADPAPVAAASPAAAAEQPAEAPAPVDAGAPVDGEETHLDVAAAESQQAPAVSETTGAVQNPPAPPAAPAPVAEAQAPVDAGAPVDGEVTHLDVAAEESQQAPAVSETTGAVKNPPTPPADPAPIAEAHAPVDAQLLFDTAEARIDGGEAHLDAADAEPQQPAAVAEATGAVQDPPVPPADPAPADEAQASFDAHLLFDDAEARIDGAEAHLDAAAAEPQQPAAVAETSGAVPHPLEPPILTDEVDFELPGDGESVAGDAQPLAATLPPESPAQPDTETQSEAEAFEDLAAATHLHEISDSMAELLFREEQAHTSESLLEADAPSEVGQSAERTALMLQLDEDAAPESELEAEAPVANTVVF